MNELKNPKPVKIETMPGQDAAGLNALVSFINDPALTDPNHDPSVRRIAPPPAPPSLPPTPKAKPVEPQPPITAHFNSQKIFYTGQLGVGKDHVAAASGALIFGFADPMYQVASHFFGVEVTATKNKDLPGMRKFLQILGQWGKGIVNEDYPYTPTRACFITMIRSLGALGKFDPSVNWGDYGTKESLWTDSLIRRAAGAPADRRIAATNARFDVEFNALSAAGWTHFHVMCSPATWERRLASKKLTPNSKELADISEHMAIKMNRGVLQMIKEPGPKIKCVWNDTTPCPSPRLFTLNEFLSEVSINHTLEVTNNMAAE